jgi:hypothetical protein
MNSLRGVAPFLLCSVPGDLGFSWGHGVVGPSLRRVIDAARGKGATVGVFHLIPRPSILRACLSLPELGTRHSALEAGRDDASSSATRARLGAGSVPSLR